MRMGVVVGLGTNEPSSLPPATKLGQGNVFTGVCDSVNGGVPGPGGGWSRGVSAPGGSARGRGAWWRPPGTATAAGGTHPTGMHSCFQHEISKINVQGNFYFVNVATAVV